MTYGDLGARPTAAGFHAAGSVELACVDPAGRLALLQPGDEVISVDGTAVRTALDLSSLLRRSPAPHVVRLLRGGIQVTLSVPG